MKMLPLASGAFPLASAASASGFGCATLLTSCLIEVYFAERLMHKPCTDINKHLT